MNEELNRLLTGLPTGDGGVPLIAEIGINHNGDVSLAKRLMQMAADLGCAAVKFQKRTIPIVYSPEVLGSLRESPWGSTQSHQKYGLEFGKAQYDEFDAYAQQLGIAWTASAWDLESLDFVESYQPPFHKVASALATNRDFLFAIAELGRFTMLSTGMMTWGDIDQAVSILSGAGTPFMLMHTVSTYPTPENTLNLRMIQKLSDRYGVAVGYSGHEASVSPSIAAVALGAVCVERHITLDRTMYGSDQAASLGENGLRELSGALRRFPSWLGTGDKQISADEAAVAAKLRYWDSM